MHAYDVLGSPVRRRIVELLLDGGRTPGAISDVIRREFGISQPAVSHHLRILRDSGFTVAQAVGTCRLYTVNVEPLREVDRWLERFRRFWGQRLDVLTTELAQTTEPVRITDRTATASHENTNNAVDHDSQLGTRRTGWTMTDILDAFNAAQREISRSRIQSGDAWRVTLRRTYHAPIEDVWDAITNPDRLRRWFLPVTVEPRLGGKFQLEGNAGGEIIGCEPPRLLRVTWAFGENITEKDINEVEVRLSAAPDGGTLFELSHSAPPQRALGPVRPWRHRGGLGHRPDQPRAAPAG